LTQPEVALLPTGAVDVPLASRRRERDARPVDAGRGGRRAARVVDTAIGHATDALHTDHSRKGTVIVGHAEEARDTASIDAAPAGVAVVTAVTTSRLTEPEVAALIGAAFFVGPTSRRAHTAETVATIGGRTLAGLPAPTDDRAAPEDAEIAGRTVTVPTAHERPYAPVRQDVADLSRPTVAVTETAGRDTARVAATKSAGALGSAHALAPEDAAALFATRTGGAFGVVGAVTGEEAAALQTVERGRTAATWSTRGERLTTPVDAIFPRIAI
jgi:hypothetical protein